LDVGSSIREFDNFLFFAGGGDVSTVTSTHDESDL